MDRVSSAAKNIQADFSLFKNPPAHCNVICVHSAVKTEMGLYDLMFAGSKLNVAV